MAFRVELLVIGMCLAVRLLGLAVPTWYVLI